MGYTNGFSKFKKTYGKKKSLGSYLRFLNKKPFGKYAKKTSQPKVSFAKRVNAVISRKVENKISPSNNTDGYIGFWVTGAPSPTWYKKTFMADLDMAQGAGQGNRIGNQYKLKKWIVKGTIHPSQEVDPTASTGQYLRYSYQGFAMLYLVKKVIGDEPESNLPSFFQNGNSAYDATGSYIDHLLKVNNDRYKVYYRRKFKLGPSQSYQGGLDNNKMLSNNDFRLTADFGFDICKYIGKNATIKFNDSATNANYPSSMRGLSLMVVWSPPFGSFSATTLASSTTFYKVTCHSHFEYEDA